MGSVPPHTQTAAPERLLDLRLTLDMQCCHADGRPRFLDIVARSGPDSGMPWEDIYNVFMLPIAEATPGAV